MSDPKPAFLDPAPRLALRSADAPAPETLRADIDRVLSRPFTVGDVVRATHALMRRMDLERGKSPLQGEKADS